MEALQAYGLGLDGVRRIVGENPSDAPTLLTLLVGTMDVQRDGWGEQQLYASVVQADTGALPAGAYVAGIGIRASPGFVVAIHRAQAYVVDAALGPLIWPLGYRPLDSFLLEAAAGAPSSPGAGVDLTNPYAPGAVAPAYAAGPFFAAREDGLTSGCLALDEEQGPAAASSRRARYDPAIPLYLRGDRADATGVRRYVSCLTYTWARTALVGQQDSAFLVVHHTVAPAGVYPFA